MLKGQVALQLDFTKMHIEMTDYEYIFGKKLPKPPKLTWHSHTHFTLQSTWKMINSTWKSLEFYFANRPGFGSLCYDFALFEVSNIIHCFYTCLFIYICLDICLDKSIKILDNIGHLEQCKIMTSVI